MFGGHLLQELPDIFKMTQWSADNLQTLLMAPAIADQSMALALFSNSSQIGGRMPVRFHIFVLLPRVRILARFHNSVSRPWDKSQCFSGWVTMNVSLRCTSKWFRQKVGLSPSRGPDVDPQQKTATTMRFFVRSLALWDGVHDTLAIFSQILRHTTTNILMNETASLPPSTLFCRASSLPAIQDRKHSRHPRGRPHLSSPGECAR